MALWREALLARAVLKEETRGYRHHPQLERFKCCAEPVVAIDLYLQAVYEESLKRGYHFSSGKYSFHTAGLKIRITEGQMFYEWTHLLRKLRERDPERRREILAVKKPEPHPLFKVRPGAVEPWERVPE